MFKKHPLKNFPTGTLVALGLSVNSLYLAAQETKVPKHQHQYKLAEKN